MENSCEGENFVENSILLKKLLFSKPKPTEPEKATYQEEHIPLSGPRN